MGDGRGSSGQPFGPLVRQVIAMHPVHLHLALKGIGDDIQIISIYVIPKIHLKIIKGLTTTPLCQVPYFVSMLVPIKAGFGNNCFWCHW